MISDSKNTIYFNIYQKSNPKFNIKISKKAIDAINKLYGDESIQFNSFITYLSQENISTITQEKTMKKELDDTEANILSEGLNNLGKYYIIPEFFKIWLNEKNVMSVSFLLLNLIDTVGINLKILSNK